MKKRIIFILLAIVILLFLMVCKGDDGAVYFAFDWYAGELDWLYWDDPNLPDTIWDEVHYATEPDDYYAEWTYDSDAFFYYLYYKVEADEGQAVNQDGADRYFTLALYYDGWYSYTYFEKSSDPRVPELLEKFKQTSQRMRSSDTNGQASINKANEPVNKDGLEKVDLFTISETKGGYKLTATYCVWFPTE